MEIMQTTSSTFLEAYTRDCLDRAALELDLDLLVDRLRPRIVVEQGTDGGWVAHCPDLPGLGVAAETREEVEALMIDGMRTYLEEFRNGTS